MKKEISLKDLRLAAHGAIVDLCEKLPVNEREIALRFAVMYAFIFAEANKADEGQEGNKIIPDLLAWTHTVQEAITNYAYDSDYGLNYGSAGWVNMVDYGDMIDEDGWIPVNTDMKMY